MGLQIIPVYSDNYQIDYNQTQLYEYGLP